LSAVTPIADKLLRRLDCPLSAKSGLMHRYKHQLYSIISAVLVSKLVTCEHREAAKNHRGSNPSPRLFIERV
jgi:hypothetical protein